MIEKEKYTPPEAKKISLQDLFDPQQDSSRYASLIQRQEGQITSSGRGVLSSTPYSEWWRFITRRSVEGSLDVRNFHQEAKEDYKILDRLFREHLKGATLIDLGSSTGNWIEELADKYEVATYIRVDRDIEDDKYGELPPDPQTAIEDIKHGDRQRISVKADMLDFIARLRQNTLNFTLNGIDRIIIDNTKYHEALAQELFRVAQKGSLIFGLDSYALEILEEYAAQEGSKIKEHILDEIPVMQTTKGRVFEVIK